MGENSIDNCTKQMTQFILADDLALIGEALTAFESYDFAEDVKRRMQALGLSASALGKRCHVSHTMVGKWCSGKARPHGKERIKELGMALSMNECELNAFLYANCYPKLYAKNPLDNACKLVLKTLRGRENTVQMYRDFLSLYGLADYSPSPDRLDIATTVMSRNFDAVDGRSDFERWLKQQEKYFGASAKTQMPNTRLIRFILLYIGSSTIYEMYAAGELPVPLKNLLYLLVADKEIAVRGLRDKLVAFGLYSNMTEEEMNVMLKYANLRQLSQPKTKLDFAVLTALRCAHERYPYFEYDGMKRITKHLQDALETAEEHEKKRLLALYQLFKAQLENASARVRYYEDDGHKSEMDRLFEREYTSYTGRGIIDYMQDILTALSENGQLHHDKMRNMLGLIGNQT